MIYDYENDDYEYDYHDLIEDTDFIDDEPYYDDGTDEPWLGTDADENDVMDSTGWENYYHNITDELDD